MDNSIHQDDKQYHQEKEKKLRDKLRYLWTQYRNDMKSGDKVRQSNRKQQIDYLTKELIESKKIINTNLGNKVKD